MPNAAGQRDGESARCFEGERVMTCGHDGSIGQGGREAEKEAIRPCTRRHIPGIFSGLC